MPDGEYGKPDILKLRGETDISALPGIVIQWDELTERLPHDY